MRLNLKALLLLLSAVVVFIIFAVYMRCVDFSFSQHLQRHWQHDGGLDQNGVEQTSSMDSMILQSIDCTINQEYIVHCKRDEQHNEIYVPFSFLRKYFDISGSLVKEHEVPQFNWWHSTAKVNQPKAKYEPRGIYMYFENYNVEVRERVKCISAAYGVPVSTQWEKRGYYYPTQIAQFALAHYSKNLTESPPQISVLENADDQQLQWSLPKRSNLTRLWHPRFNTTIVQYETAINYESAVYVDLNRTMSDFVLSVDMLLVTNSSSLMVTLRNRETKHIYTLHYIPAELQLSVQGSNIYYGLGLAALNKWRHITRDLQTDVQKGILAVDKRSPLKMRRSDLSIMSISLLGVGFFDNMTLATSAHMAHFYDAAEWFVRNQNNKTGGWPNPVRRSLNGFAELKSGWLSAMGQGHAISVLARAYHHSGGDKRYLRAASRAMKPFYKLSKDGGVLAQFMDKYSWYEEYPTTPASFVLNGFIYSLLGLYDLNAIAPGSIAREAGKLYQQGMQSLKGMLLLYDTGAGTTYDLRHLSLGIAPNLARWDYHATHVNQLLLLATIDSDPLFERTAERWRGYMHGKRAKHN